ASAVFGRLGVNRETVDLREPFLDAALQQGGEVVDVSDGQVAVHRAVAGNQYAVFDAANVNFVTIHQFVIFRRKRIQELLDGARKFLHFLGTNDARAKRLDVNIDARSRIG